MGNTLSLRINLYQSPIHDRQVRASFLKLVCINFLIFSHSTSRKYLTYIVDF